MFYHFLAPEGGHPTLEENSTEKKQNARSFFLSHTSKLNQQKQWDVVSKSTAKIYPSNKYNIFPSFIIDQSWNTLQLKNIVLSFHPPFEPITSLFTITGLWPTMVSRLIARRSCRASDPMTTCMDGLVPDARLWLGPKWLNLMSCTLRAHFFVSLITVCWFDLIVTLWWCIES